MRLNIWSGKETIFFNSLSDANLGCSICSVISYSLQYQVVPNELCLKNMKIFSYFKIYRCETSLHHIGNKFVHLICFRY